MLYGIHLILTYKCTRECDHCWFYCSPKTEGTFTINQIKEVLNEARKIETEWIYFEGGEPFLYYPILLEGLKIAHDMGFKTGIATNAYWATSFKEAKRLLKPISMLNVSILGISDDSFHIDNNSEITPSTIATRVAGDLDMKVLMLSVNKPSVEEIMGHERRVVFKGRAVEKLTENLPKKFWKDFGRCPNRDLVNPNKLHVDSFGNVQICQGISIGNMWKTPLSDLVENYDVKLNPICYPLLKGGPALLAKKYNVDHNDEYIDECHFCSIIRKALLDEFPEHLTPKQVYGFK